MTLSAVTSPLVTAPRITTSSPGRNRFDAAAVPSTPNRVRDVMVILISASARVRTVHVEPDWFTMTARTIVRAPAADACPPVGVATGVGVAGAMTAGAAVTAVHVESPDTAAVAPNQTATAVTATATAIAAMEVACRRSQDSRGVGRSGGGGTNGIGSVGWVTAPPSSMPMHDVLSICQGLVWSCRGRYGQAD
jgi:hypothetical protein